MKVLKRIAVLRASLLPEPSDPRATYDGPFKLNQPDAVFGLE